ncbi:MAG: hypothetical protein JW909_05845 [Planctomycetes bacterium]|nr:hypothetical protein [Planctomycetota bacterium]
MPVEGKVARIIDDATVIISCGAESGVRPGMVFAVVLPVDEVFDPDSGENLGRWEAVKGRLQVLHVQDRMSICAPALDRADGLAFDPATHTLSAEMIQVSLARSRSSSLNVDKSQAAGMPGLSPIRVGDKVRSVD